MAVFIWSYGSTNIDFTYILDGKMRSSWFFSLLYLSHGYFDWSVWNQNSYQCRIHKIIRSWFRWRKRLGSITKITTIIHLMATSIKAAVYDKCEQRHVIFCSKSICVQYQFLKKEFLYFLIILFTSLKINHIKKHSEKAYTSTSVTFDLYVWSWPYVR